MNVKTIAVSLLTVGMLAGCSDYAGSTATGARPMGTASTAPSAASKEPEPGNSLPVGASISGPVTNGTGRVGTTRY